MCKGPEESQSMVCNGMRRAGDMRLIGSPLGYFIFYNCLSWAFFSLSVIEIYLVCKIHIFTVCIFKLIHIYTSVISSPQLRY